MIEKLKKMQELWKELALGGIWIATIAGSFLLPLPDWARSDENDSYTKFIVFIATVLAGFVLILSFKHRQKKLWGYISLVSLLIFCISFFLYMELRNSVTLPYKDVNTANASEEIRRIVIGQDTVIGFTAKKLAMEAYLGFPVLPKDILNYAGGDATNFWTEESISRNKYKLIFLLILAYSVLSIFLISFLNFLLIGNPSKKSIVIILLFIGAGAHAQNDSIVAKTELSRLNTMFGYKAKLRFEPTFSSAQLNEVINISLPELKKISSITEKDIRLYLVRFIVAHEFAHHIQFYKYKNNPSYMKADYMTQMLLEAQADVLGGFMLGKLSPELSIYLQTHQEKMNTIFNKLFVIVYKNGTKQNTHGTHPSKSNRLMAMRLGFYSGIIHNLDEMVKNQVASGGTPSISIDNYKSFFRKHFEFIDLIQNESSVEWSYRQAKKIIEYDRSIANNIVLITPISETHFYKTEPQDANYHYNLTYKNIGKKDIYIEMEVYVANIENIEGRDYVDKFCTEQYKYTIRAGETYNLRGKLSWKERKWAKEINSTTINNNFTKLIYPGSYTDDALISCSYTNTENIAVPDTKIEYLGFSSNNPNSLDFANFYQMLFNKISLSGKTTTGVGRMHDLYKNTVVYASSIQFEENSHTYILVNTSDKSMPSVEVIYPFSNQAKYNQLKSLIKQKWPDGKIDEVVRGNVTTFILEVNEVYITLEFIKRTKSDKSTIQLSFFWE